MKPRTTLFLVAVFAALAAYVYLGELKRPATTGPTTPTPAPLWSVVGDQVTGLTVRGNGGEVRLARPAGGVWRIEAPLQDVADAVRVSRVIASLTTLYASRTLTGTLGPPEDYGLAQPAMQLVVKAADGSESTLLIGSTNPQKDAHYVQVQGQSQIHLLPVSLIQSLQDLLDRPPVQPTPTVAATPTGAVTPPLHATP